MTSATPGPIPIIRAGDNSSNAMSDGTPIARPSSSSSYLGLSAGLSGSSSFKEAMAVSFGKDVAEMLEYSIGRFSSSTDSEATVAAPSSVRLESTFCRNFTCCGKELDDLHDLLQHYEECHVRFEDDDVESMMTDEDMETTSMTSDTAPSESSTSSLTGMKPANGTHDHSIRAGHPRPLLSTPATGTPMVSTTNENLEYPSAFDTAVMCSPNRGKKRSHGQQVSGSTSNPLFRTILETGGRHPLGMSSAYSSPFSSPGNSRAATPTMDSENEVFFGSSTQPNMFASLSIRGGSTDDQLPSCAPPNLFFPSANASSLQRPMKRERFSTSSATNTSTNAGSSTPVGVPPLSSVENGAATEHRPYKCPAPGCDKAYKQMNGLKYHRLHGHCNQNLRNVNQGVTGSNVPSSSSTSTPGTATSSPSSNATANPFISGGSPQTPSCPDAAISSVSTSMSSSSTPATVSSTPGLSTEPTRDANMVSGISTPSQGMFSPTLNLASTESSSTSKPDSVPASAKNGGISSVQPEKAYVCQVGNCDKRYKNLNGLRYHYLHSGSHGLLGLQLLHANGGGASAKADSVSGRPPVSTDTLSREQIVQAAAAAQALLNQQGANCSRGPNGNPNPNLTASAFLSSTTNNTITMSNAPEPF